MSTDYRGARGSNAGDDFHELWVVRQAIRLLSNEDDLEAIAVEGVGPDDESGKPKDTWDGVDCILYFGGRSAAEANRVEIVQVKYSSAQSNKPWTVARLAYGQQPERSVVGKLAKAWKGLEAPPEKESAIAAILISNQPIAEDVLQIIEAAATGQAGALRDKSSTLGKQETRLVKATGLKGDALKRFAASLRLEGEIGSRLAIEESVLRSIAQWAEHDIQQHVANLQHYVRRKMMPECADELITRESVLSWVGVSDTEALFPCPSHIQVVRDPVSRESVQKAAKAMRAGAQHICLHGEAGVGKTTALQEIEHNLPPGSVVVKYDCYGGGRYLDPSALRHRTKDAFLQVTNELATCLKLPLFVVPSSSTDYPRLLDRRLKYAAQVISSRVNGALVVIAIDAADNAIFATQDRKPPEPSFVHEFVGLRKLPDNVRFIVTARTGRLEGLLLPPYYERFEVPPFSQQETNEHVSRVWSAPQAWMEDFHHFSGGVPRVQAAAFANTGDNPSAAIDRLMPNGKSLEDIFRERFEDATQKAGVETDLRRLCAGLVALPRPVPLSALAAVLDQTEAQLLDICRDLAPSIRCEDNSVSFADEDLEHFVRDSAQDGLEDIEGQVAEWMLEHHDCDGYAAVNVASSLLAANRRAELLELVESTPTPQPGTVPNPILRREVELQRLRLAIAVCREAADVPRALRLVLIGAESIKTEDALCNLLTENADLSVRFAEDASRRLVLSDRKLMEDHGHFLFQKLAVDASRGDAISVREGRRRLEAWFDLRNEHQQKGVHNHGWNISISDISCMVEATLKLHGFAAALADLKRWQPKQVALQVGLTLPWKLIAENNEVDIDSVTNDHLSPLHALFFLVPLALAGRSVDTDRMAEGLRQLMRRKLPIGQFLQDYGHDSSLHGEILDIALTAGEILTAKSTASDLVDRLLYSLLDSELTQIENYLEYRAWKLDILLRAYVLRECRGGQTPKIEGLFVPRADTDESRRSAERSDEVKRIAQNAFDIYKVVATALVKQRGNTKIEKDLSRACGHLSAGGWHFLRYGAGRLPGCVAAQLGVLLSTGYNPEGLWQMATQVHGEWKNGEVVPDGRFVARFSLWPQLREHLISDIGAAAKMTRGARIAAGDKTDTLVRYARHLAPFSKPDAEAVFNYAVDAVGELDGEVMDQIRLVDYLIAHAAVGDDVFEDRRKTARQLSDVVVDAAIRLNGYRHFPWQEAMSALARLDVPLSLANVARWHDEDIVQLFKTLSAALRTAISSRAIRSKQGAALALFLDDDSEIVSEVLKSANDLCSTALAEEAAYDTLIYGSGNGKEVLQYIETNESCGQWVEALRRREHFLGTLPPQPSPGVADGAQEAKGDDSPIDSQTWRNDMLTDAATLSEAVEMLAGQDDSGGQILRIRAILDSARSSVSPAQRVGHLDALAELKPRKAMIGTIAEAILTAVGTWSSSPSVSVWCQDRLPEVIVARFTEFTQYLPYEGRLSAALKCTGLGNDACNNLILRGLERNVGELSAAAIFSLAGIAGCNLSTTDTAALVDWYAGRLASRIPAKHRDQTTALDELPESIDEAVARFLFAHLGDCDLRLRWRAAHAIRRLARVGDVDTLEALINEYNRLEEQAFRGRGDPFYWLAARLWFVLSWDRIAGETPNVATRAANVLLEIAVSESFPHVLVRSFARDACEKLVSAGYISPRDEELNQLRLVNKSLLPRSQKSHSAHGSFGYGNEGRRFHFNTTDTLPYWYEPMLRSFASLDNERFLQEAERWIIDVWGHSGGIRAFDERPRDKRFKRSGLALQSHYHGSIPTLERLSKHLEWHAMWCAVGEFLKTEPLPSPDEYAWSELEDRIREEMLGEPPLWSSDLLVPVPLQVRYWREDSGKLEDWVLDVNEAFHRSQVFPTDWADYIVVDGSSARRWGEYGEYRERVGVSSALVDPKTGRPLLRALQTMEDHMDYKMPDEGEEGVEVDEAPYRFIGWLQSGSHGGGIDKKDPFRAYGFAIGTRPGNWVVEACALRRDGDGRPYWYGSDGENPMFIYEAWGKDDEGESDYSQRLTVAGTRLLAHKEQLLNFLCGEELDLIIEVGVTRNGREAGQYSGEEEGAKPEGRFARLYRLDHRGGLEVAEGCVGTWTGDCSAA